MNLPSLLPRLAPWERGRFYLAALAFMCVATGALIARAVGDSLLLSRLGSDPLPFMYIIGALATGLGAYACARAAPRLSTAKIGIVVAAILLLANLGVFLSLAIFPVISRMTAYLLADIAGRIPVILYWALMTEVFDAGESRRLFGLLGAVGTAACLPAGMLIGPFAQQFGLPFLILVVCGLLIGYMFAARALERREIDERAPAERRSLVAANAQSAAHLHRQSQFITIAALAVITSLVQTLIDFQFKASFASVATGPALAAIFGRLYAYASLAALFLQLFLVHRILRWGGVLVSLSLLPAGLFLTSAAVLQTASTAWVYATKAFDITLTLTLNGTARHMLYRGIRSESRLQARTLAEGLYQPLAIATAGSILFFTIDSLTVRILAATTIAGCLLWWLVARTAYRSYVRGLLNSLRAGRLDPFDKTMTAREPAVREYVMNALASGSEEQVKYLAAVLPNILPLAAHPDPEVRWTVVRAAAAGDFKAEEAWLRERMSDPNPRVRAFAAAGLINTAKGTAARDSIRTIEALVYSPAAEDRQAAAEGLGEMRRGGFTPLLGRLLAAEEEEVLEAALEACRNHPDRALIRGILPLMSRRRLAAEAADALVAIGPPAIRPVALFLRGSRGPLRAEAVKELANALGREGNTVALPLLKRMLAIVRTEEQAPVFAAYSGLVKRRQGALNVPEEIDPLILGEVAAAMARLKTLREIGTSVATQLLRIALKDLVSCHIHHVFILLNVRVRKIDMIALDSTFRRGSREARSQVVELLNNVLPESLEQPVLDLLSEAEAQPGEVPDPEPAVAQILEQPDSEWVTVGALFAASQLQMKSGREEIRRFLGHPDPIIRETALAALSKVEDRSTFMRISQHLTKDSDPTVRALAMELNLAG